MFKMTAVHFVGFRGDEYLSALRVFGPPDFVHPGWDLRALRDVDEGDVVVIAAGSLEARVRSWPDMIEVNDPARVEMGFAARMPRP